MSERDVPRLPMGQPRKEAIRVQYGIRMMQATVDRIERFASARSVNRTQALEMMVEEYCMVLDQEIIAPRWEALAAPRPGLRVWAREYAKRARR